MAARIRLQHQEEVREKIRTSQLINRLQDHAFGDVELSPTQIKAIEVLLRKNLPDLGAVEITGDAERPVAVEFGWKCT
jgi:hypothetical protein